MEFELTTIGLDALIKRATLAGANVVPLMSAALTNSTNEIQRLARLNAPHRTGTLQRSILTSVDYPIGIVNVNEKYGLYVEQGTAPHVILPSRKKALFWPGAASPYAAVNHPGTKANPFFQKAIDEAMEYVTDQFVHVGNNICQQLAAGSPS